MDKWVTNGTAQGPGRPSRLTLAATLFRAQRGDRDQDQPLRERLIASLRPRDAVYRYGGEESFVLLPETTLDAAAPVLERLRVQAGSREMGDAEQQITQTISIGAAEVTADEPLDDAIERADAALYRAKQAGRNRIELARERATN